jgi:hypothetical protein
MPVLNQGIYSRFCMLHRKFVNDTICEGCDDKDGVTPQHSTAYDFPKRNELEIIQIRQVCEGCPLFQVLEQTCKKIPSNPHPTDIIAQHPNNHCPEDKW